MITALLAGAGVWLAVSAPAAFYIARVFKQADREQAAGQAHFQAELERWDMTA